MKMFIMAATTKNPIGESEWIPVGKKSAEPNIPSIRRKLAESRCGKEETATIHATKLAAISSDHRYLRRRGFGPGL